jgi:hypothetical protein
VIQQPSEVVEWSVKIVITVAQSNEHVFSLAFPDWPSPSGFDFSIWPILSWTIRTQSYERICVSLASLPSSV